MTKYEKVKPTLLTISNIIEGLAQINNTTSAFTQLLQLSDTAKKIREFDLDSGNDSDLNQLRSWFVAANVRENFVRMNAQNQKLSDAEFRKLVIDTLGKSE